MTVRVNMNTVTDEADNGNTASDPTPAIHIDMIAPTVTITGLPTGEQNGDFTLKVTFSERVNGFAGIDVIANGPVTATSSRGDFVTFTVTVEVDVNSEGDVTFQVGDGGVTDDAGNGNIASAVTSAIHVDTIDPTVAISDVPDIEKNEAFDLTVTFSEPVNGFAVPGDLTVGLVAEPGVTSASPIATVAWKSGVDGEAEYMVTVTPNAAGAEGGVTVTVKMGTVQDFATNKNLVGSNAAAVHIDTIAPTVSVTGFPTIEKKDPYNLTVTFSEPVNGFAVPADLLRPMGPATAALVLGTDGASVYIVTIAPNATSEGDVTVQVNLKTVQDFALNDNTASPETDVVHVDTIVPTVSVTGFPSVTPEQNGPFTLTVTFSEPVNGFAVPADLLMFTGPATAALASGADGAAVYTVTITPNATSEGDVTVTVNAGAAQDPALNDNTASTDTDVVHVDTIPPTVEISGEPTIEKNVAFDLTVTFSEEVNGFAVADDLTMGLVSESGVASATPIAAVTLKSGVAGGAMYVVTVTPNDAGAEGDVTVQVNLKTVRDFATNLNPAGSNAAAVHIDTIDPTVSISGVPSGEQNAAFMLTITFSENVTGFATEDLTVTDQATATAVSGSGIDYTATITPNANQEGNVTVKVNMNTVTDEAGNGNTASDPTPAIHIDMIAPTVTITDLPTGEQNSNFMLEVTFSENVNGFAATDLIVTGEVATATVAPVGASKMNYIATITPNATSEGDVTFQVKKNGVTDDAGNGNIASAVTSAIHVDTIVPTVEISGEPTIEKNVAFDLTVTFSEEVNGFAVADDLTVGLVSESDVVSETPIAAVTLKSGVAGGAMYVVTVTPNAAGLKAM